jgi:hypothetical protein
MRDSCSANLLLLNPTWTILVASTNESYASRPSTYTPNQHQSSLQRPRTRRTHGSNLTRCQTRRQPSIKLTPLPLDLPPLSLPLLHPSLSPFLSLGDIIPTTPSLLFPLPLFLRRKRRKSPIYPSLSLYSFPISLLIRTITPSLLLFSLDLLPHLRFRLSTEDGTM